MRAGLGVGVGLVWIAWVAAASDVGLKKVPELAPAPVVSAAPVSSPSPIAVPSQTPSPIASPTPSASPAPPPVSVDFTRLQTEFERATQGEYQALLHRNRIEREELERSLQARTRLWEDQKVQEQRKFFDENRDPYSRRDYQRKVEQDRSAHRAELASERQKRLSAHQAAERALQEDQRRRRTEFQKHVQRKELPQIELWHKRGI